VIFNFFARLEQNCLDDLCRHVSQFFAGFAFERLAEAGMPDAIFSNQKSQFGYIWETLAMEDGGIFYYHLVYVFCGRLVYYCTDIW
jgi:hypothetical protein